MNCPRCGLEPAEHPAGRCLDAWVAEAVMDYTLGIHGPWDSETRPFDLSETDELFGDYFVAFPENTPTKDEPWSPLKEYSTRIQDAWEVVEKLVELEHELEISHVPGIWGYLVGFSKNRIYDTKIDVRFQEDEAPLAICRAALLANKRED